MMRIDLVPVGKIETSTLGELASGLSTAIDAQCQVLSSRINPEFAFHPEREQHYSSEILAFMADTLARDSGAAPSGRRLLGVASVDLYIPILTFVFGEAQFGGECAVISAHRLRQEFYGLPPDPKLFRERLLKEAIHEIGHTLSLQHCDDYLCAMASSHSVEWIDLKSAEFCSQCAARPEYESLVGGG